MLQERSSIRIVLLLGLAAGLVGLLGFLVLGGGSTSIEGPRAAEADVAAPTPAVAVAEPDAGRELVLEVDPFTSDDVDVRPGVRLGGDGVLEGRILDRASGKGVAGARVDLLPITPSAKDMLGSMLRMARPSEGMDERGLPVAVTQSAAGGHFAFRDVRRGTYFLDARGPYHVPDHLVRVRVSSSGDGGPVDCFVRAGGRVVGRVLDREGRPMPRAVVSIYHGPGSMVAAFRDGELRRLDARCDRDGRFVVAGVTPGVGYEAHAWGPGFVLTHATVGDVVPGEDSEITIRVGPGATVEGRVLLGSEEEGGARPLPGVRVGVVPRGLRDLFFGEELLAQTSVETAADGSFRIEHLPPGEAELICVLNGYQSGTSPLLVLPEEGTLRAPDLFLELGPMVQGRVVDSDGEPVSGVHVRWFTAEVANPQTFDFSVASLMHQALEGFEYPTSDADGRFVAGPFPGDAPYYLYLAKSGYSYTRAEWDPAVSGELEVVLQRGGAVEGIVMDIKAAAPVTSFLVTGVDRIDQRFDAPSSFNPFSGGELIETPDGRFRIEGVQPGSSELTFEAEGYHTETVGGFEVAEGETKRGVIVKLVPGGIVRGRVVDKAGEPVAGAEVASLSGEGWNLNRSFDRIGEHLGSGQFKDTREEYVSNAMVSFATRLGSLGTDSVTTAADGSFELNGIGVGAFQVVVKHRDYALGQSPALHMEHGQTIEGLEVVLSRGASLYGRITDRLDRPIANALVFAVSPGEFSGDGGPGAAVYQGIADEEGRYEVVNMKGGGYFVSSFRADERINPIAIASTMQFDLVNVPPDTRVEFDIIDRSAAACRVFGSVTSRTGVITTGGIVAISFESDNMLGVDVKAAQLGSDGNYEFPGLAPGAYQFLYQGGDDELRFDVEVPELPEVRIDLRLPYGGIEGRVVDASTGAPIGADMGGWVRASNLDEGEVDGLLAMFVYYGGQDRYAAVDERGRFVFEGLQAGRYGLEVVAARSGYSSGPPLTVEVRKDEVTTGIELALEAAYSMDGVVVDEGGVPVPDARVNLFRIDAAGVTWFDQASTGEGGRFEFTDLPSGEYELAAVGEETAEGTARQVLSDQAVHDIELRVARGTELVLLVRRSDGTPLPGAVATVLLPGGRPVSRARESATGMTEWFSGGLASDASGRLNAGRLNPGTYRVEVRQGGELVVLESIEVREGADRADFEVTFP